VVASAMLALLSQAGRATVNELGDSSRAPRREARLAGGTAAAAASTENMALELEVNVREVSVCRVRVGGRRRSLEARVRGMGLRECVCGGGLCFVFLLMFSVWCVCKRFICSFTNHHRSLTYVGSSSAREMSL
jgi:hypothetical protein